MSVVSCVLSVAKEGFSSGFNNIFWVRRIFFIMLPEQLDLLFVNRVKQRTTNNGPWTFVYHILAKAKSV
jgi:hypothetical protein